MEKLMKWAAILGGCVFSAMLGVVVYLGANRMVVIADTGGVSGVTEIFASEELPGHEIALQESAADGMFFRIPIESAIGPENIMVENQYAARRFIVSIRGATGFFYENSHITGYVEPLQAASYTVESEGVTLYVQFSELYECESILDKGYLQVNIYKPSDRYAKVVILDTDISTDLSSQEKEALSQIEEKCQALLEAEGIRVYSASSLRKEEGFENKQLLIEQTNASLYLGLTFAKDKNKELFGSYVNYNDLYFRPWLTNGSFADMMERELVTAIKGKALGLVEVEDGILRELSIPAAIICPGYLSHETEGKLLLTERYQDKIAEGIRSGVLKTYEEMKQE